jgi:polysaccharide biosynthesis protein PslA
MHSRRGTKWATKWAPSWVNRREQSCSIKDISLAVFRCGANTEGGLILNMHSPTPSAGIKTEKNAPSWSHVAVPTRRYSARNIGLGALAIGAFVVVLMALSVAIGSAYFAFAYQGWRPRYDFAVGGALVALCYTLPFLIRGDFTIAGYVSGKRRPGDIILAWNGAFLGLAFIAFLTKMTGTFSRVWVVSFYVLGLVTMLALEAGIRRAVIQGLKSGRIASRRLMVVGTEREIRLFNERLAMLAPAHERLAVKVASLAVLPAEMLSSDTGELTQAGSLALASAAVAARRHLPDDIVLLLSWESPAVVTACVDAFSVLPVAVHIDGGSILANTTDGEVRRFGAAHALALTPRPPSPFHLALKRLFDVIASFVGLILLSPVFIAVAIAIRRESKGPILFLQDRRGFNQQIFTIFKFRSMHTLDNGTSIEQARVDDERITKVGAWLRRTNLDELPQLVNVLRGDMSLVGPRPHAVAHDQDYEARIPRYQRRLNMRPGITGWAQVNGFRGETDTDEKMRRRVEHDIYYIDNWSMALDAYILFLTFVSRRATKNAR